jgi:hypothetical protein
MVAWSSTFVAATAVAVGQTVFALIPPALEERQADPCAAIAGQTYVVPSKARACLKYVHFSEDRLKSSDSNCVADVCYFNPALSRSTLP